MIFKSSSFFKKKNINHAFFSRKNGVSKGIYKSLNCGLGSKDNKKNIYKNIELIKKKINAVSVVLPHQKHSNKIIILKKLPLKKNSKISTGDGIFTKLSNVGIGILTADCAPILFAENSNKYICCVHAGWKGAFGNIIKNAITLFKKNKIKLKDIRVCVGPCISVKSYEVKLDFYQKFISNNKSYRSCFVFKKNKIFFNLRYFVILKILESKIIKSNISHVNYDTYSNKSLFFSYRRSIIKAEKDYGRNLSVIIKYN
jgi:YfiH family protein